MCHGMDFFGFFNLRLAQLLEYIGVFLLPNWDHFQALFLGITQSSPLNGKDMF